MSLGAEREASRPAANSQLRIVLSKLRSCSLLSVAGPSAGVVGLPWDSVVTDGGGNVTGLDDVTVPTDGGVRGCSGGRENALWIA